MVETGSLVSKPEVMAKTGRKRLWDVYDPQFTVIFVASTLRWAPGDELYLLNISIPHDEVWQSHWLS